MSYCWRWNLEQKGFTEVNWREYGEWQIKVSTYVAKYLSPSIEHANCGWNHCVFKVMKNQYGMEEYIELCPTKEEDGGGRWINVSGNSLGAIAEEVWGNVYN